MVLQSLDCHLHVCKAGCELCINSAIYPRFEL
jgi:hypothetical protein